VLVLGYLGWRRLTSGADPEDVGDVRTNLRLREAPRKFAVPAKHRSHRANDYRLPGPVEGGMGPQRRETAIRAATLGPREFSLALLEESSQAVRELER